MSFCRIAFCQLLFNEYCIVLYCINAYDLLQAVTLDQTSRQTKWDFSFYE